MAFHAKAMVLVEVGLSSHHRISYTQWWNEELMKNELNLLEGKMRAFQAQDYFLPAGGSLLLQLQGEDQAILARWPSTSKGVAKYPRSGSRSSRAKLGRALQDSQNSSIDDLPAREDGWHRATKSLEYGTPMEVLSISYYIEIFALCIGSRNSTINNKAIKSICLIRLFICLHSLLTNLTVEHILSFSSIPSI